MSQDDLFPMKGESTGVTSESINRQMVRVERALELLMGALLHNDLYEIHFGDIRVTRNHYFPENKYGVWNGALRCYLGSNGGWMQDRANESDIFEGDKRAAIEAALKAILESQCTS